MDLKDTQAEEYFFQDKEFSSFMYEIRRKTIDLISKSIKENSLIQIGDIIEISHYNDFVKAKVHEIKLCGSHGMDGYKFSFNYKGLLLNKKGEIMKNRLPVWFSCYLVNGKKYTNPSSNRYIIIPATIEGSLV